MCSTRPIALSRLLSPLRLLAVCALRWPPPPWRAVLGSQAAELCVLARPMLPAVCGSFKDGVLQVAAAGGRSSRCCCSGFWASSRCCSTSPSTSSTMPAATVRMRTHDLRRSAFGQSTLQRRLDSTRASNGSAVTFSARVGTLEQQSPAVRPGQLQYSYRASGRPRMNSMPPLAATGRMNAS